MRSLVSTLVFSSVISQASININTLPPDLRNLDFLERIPPRSTIDPAWAGQHSAALDGDQNKVSLSWTLDGDSIEFQVNHSPKSAICNLPAVSFRAIRYLARMDILGRLRCWPH